ncbi:MAG: MFS transporter [Anaerolineae bacterium]
MYSKATSQRLLYTLFVLQSLYTASQIAVFTLIVIVAARLSGSERMAGFPSSTLTFAQALSALPIALIMGRFGRRLGLTLGYAAGALGGVVGIIAVTQAVFPLLLVSAALLGIGRASSDQGRFAAGEMFPEAERARMIGRLVFAGAISAIVGPLLVSPSSSIMQSLGLHPDAGPWGVAVVFTSLAALLAFFLLRPDPMLVARSIAEAERKNTAGDQPQIARSLSTLLRLPKVQLAITGALVSQTVMVILMLMTPLHMDHNHHGRDVISMVISMHTLGMFGLSPLTGYLIDRYGRVAMLFAGALILIISALLAPLSVNQYILALALFLLGLGWNFGYVSSTSLLADALEGEERARVQGINDSLSFFVAGTGGLAAGALFESGGYAAISMAGLLLTLVLVAAIFWFQRPQLRVQSA